jgi:CheY-like chemotaxis protein
MKGKVILIADDDEADVLFVTEALGTACPGVTVKAVADGKQTVDYLAGRGEYGDRGSYPFPNHLFLDLKMPLISGFEVLEWLRAHPEIGQLRVTVLSGSMLEDDMKRARSLGAEYIVKPVEYDALLKEMREFCRKHLVR